MTRNRGLDHPFAHIGHKMRSRAILARQNQDWKPSLRREYQQVDRLMLMLKAPNRHRPNRATASTTTVENTAKPIGPTADESIQHKQQSLPLSDNPTDRQER